MIILKPKVTEKAAKQQEKQKVYTFIVPEKMNKIEIKQVLFKKFSVEAMRVNTANYLGKKIVKYTKKGVQRGKQSNFKKAFVTLKKGQEINLYQQQS